jgi:hypothetical protein
MPAPKSHAARRGRSSRDKPINLTYGILLFLITLPPRMLWFADPIYGVVAIVGGMTYIALASKSAK